MTRRKQEETRDYRAEARRVRAEAQAALRALRAQRSARGGAKAPAAVQSGAPSEAAPEAEPEAPPPSAAAPLPTSASDSFFVSARASSISRASGGAGDAEAIEPPEYEPPPGIETAEDDPAPATEAASTPEASGNDPGGDSPACDLERLPGAGPGLVWLLREAGYGSLADLAAADAESLGEKLGVIGGLLDLDAWIALAARLRDEETETIS